MDNKEKMKQSMKNRRLNVVITVLLGIIIFVTLLFFGVQLLLPSGVSYIPEIAVLISILLCIVWIIIVIAALCFLKSHIKEQLNVVWKILLKIILVVAGITTCLFLIYFKL